jgi:hypothetical protein
MRDKGSKYWVGADAPALQARFRELVGIQERMNAAKAKG